MIPVLRTALGGVFSQLRDVLEGVGHTTPERVLREAAEYARASGVGQGEAYEILRRVYAGTKQDPERALATTLVVAAKQALPMVSDPARLSEVVSRPRLTERRCECVRSALTIEPQGRCPACGLRIYDVDK